MFVVLLHCTGIICFIYSASNMHKVIPFTSFNSQPLSLQLSITFSVGMCSFGGVLITSVRVPLSIFHIIEHSIFVFPLFLSLSFIMDDLLALSSRSMVLFSTASKIWLGASLELSTLTMILSPFSTFNLGF